MLQAIHNHPNRSIVIAFSALGVGALVLAVSCATGGYFTMGAIHTFRSSFGSVLSFKAHVIGASVSGFFALTGTCLVITWIVLLILISRDNDTSKDFDKIIKNVDKMQIAGEELVILTQNLCDDKIQELEKKRRNHSYDDKIKEIKKNKEEAKKLRKEIQSKRKNIESWL